MESLNQDNTKSQHFITKIYSHPIYGTIIKDSYVLIFSDNLDKPFEFDLKKEADCPNKWKDFAMKNFKNTFLPANY